MVIIDRNTIVTGIHPEKTKASLKISIYPNPAGEKCFIDLGKKYPSLMMQILTLQDQQIHMNCDVRFQNCNVRFNYLGTRDQQSDVKDGVSVLIIQ